MRLASHPGFPSSATRHRAAGRSSSTEAADSTARYKGPALLRSNLKALLFLHRLPEDWVPTTRGANCSKHPQAARPAPYFPHMAHSSRGSSAQGGAGAIRPQRAGFSHTGPQGESRQGEARYQPRGLMCASLPQEQAVGISVLFTSFLAPAGWVLHHLDHYKKGSGA